MRKLIPGVNDLATVNPEVASEWHPTKNGELTSAQVKPGSNKKVWWLCSKCRHEWETRVDHRTYMNSSCPVCSRISQAENHTKNLIKKRGSLASVHPELVKEWHPTKNGALTPFDITPNSSDKIWWRCSEGHEWEAFASNRSKGIGCPYCSNQKVLPGSNDLATTHPEVAAEWHYEKNGELTPEQFVAGSDKKVWWLGKCGHEWKSAIKNRALHSNGCPICQKENQTSFPEQAIFYYLNQLTPAENRYLLDGKTEIDIYLPELCIGIEYDGGYYHKGNEKKDAKKNETLTSAGIFLIRVKETEPSLTPKDTDAVIYCQYSASYTYLNEVIAKILDRINLLIKAKFTLDIDVIRDRTNIYDLYIENVKQNSLAVLRPELAAEWHPAKNGTLKPTQIKFKANKKVWWLGTCGHEFEAVVAARSEGQGCPICAGRQVLPGYNDLATVKPELAAEWHPTKNGALTPEQVTAGSNKKVWWRCANGHEWQAVINNRTKGRGCPDCYKENRKK